MENSDKDQRKEKEAIKKLEVVGDFPCTSFLGDGLRRSRSLPNLYMSPKEGESGGYISASESEGQLVLRHIKEEELEAHPCLLIENISEVIFKHILDKSRSRKDAAKDVRNIRLVCKQWKDSVTRVYRRDGPTITFSDYDRMVNNAETRLSFTQFMDTMKSSEMIPVQKFKFRLRLFRTENLNLFEEFFRIFGPQVVSLQMIMAALATLTDEAGMLTLNNLNMPKLKILKLALNDFTHQSQHHVFKQLIEDFLIAAKTLKELEVSYSFGGGSLSRSQRASLVQELGPLIGRRIPRTVKELKLSFELNESTFHNLTEAGLELEGVELGVPKLADKLTFYRFLQSQAPTLKGASI